MARLGSQCRAWRLPFPWAPGLKLVIDYDTLEASGTDSAVANRYPAGRKGRYDPKLLDALARAKTKAALQGLSELVLGRSPRDVLGAGRDVDTGLLLVVVATK